MDGCDLYAFVSDVQVLDCSCGFQWMGCGCWLRFFIVIV